MRTEYYLFIGMIMSFLLTACSSKDGDIDSDITHFAYQETENGKWGIMSTEGEIVVPPTFQNVPTVVTDDMFFVPRQDGTYELHSINEPEKIIDANYTDVTNFSDGKAFVTREGENISCIDKKGNVLFTLSQDIETAFNFLNKKRASIINKEGRWGYIDMNGKVIIPCKYLFSTPFTHNYAIAVEDDKTAYLIDSNGNKITTVNADKQQETLLLIQENLSSWMGDVNNGIIPYVADGGFGLKTIEEKIIISASPKYKLITSFINGYYVYRTEKGYGVMDKNGKEIIKDKYPLISDFNLNNNGIFIACIDNKWGILSINNEKLLCPFEYDYITAISKSSSYFIGIKNQVIYLITKNGSIKRQFKQINATIKGIIERNV